MQKLVWFVAALCLANLVILCLHLTVRDHVSEGAWGWVIALATVIAFNVLRLVWWPFADES